MDDETIRLILQVKGEDEVKGLRTATTDLRQALRDAVMAKGSLDEAMRDPSIKKAAADLADMEKELGRLETALAGASKAGASGGQAIMQWSRAAQDYMAAGFGGIANNLELMITSLGGPAMLAGVATLAGAFGPKIAELIGGMFEEGVKAGATRLEELEAKLKKLEDKPVKLLVDYAEIKAAEAEIEKLKKAKQELDALLGKQTRTERESGQGVSEAIVETEGGQQLLKQMVEDAQTEAEFKALGSKPGQAAEAKIRKARETLKEANAISDSPYDTVRKGIATANAQQALRAAEAERDALVAAAQKDATSSIETAYTAATSGKGLEQAEGQRKLFDLFQGSGTQTGMAVADRIVQSAPSVLKAREAQEAAAKQAEEEARAQAKAQAAQEKADKQAETEREKAAREAQRQQEQADREQEAAEKAASQAKDRELKEQIRAGKELLGAPGMKEQVERALLMGGDVKSLAPGLGTMAERAGLAPRGGGWQVGAAAVGEAQEDVNKKMLGLQAQGLSRDEAKAALLQQVINELDDMAARAARLEQQYLTMGAQAAALRNTRAAQGRR